MVIQTEITAQALLNQNANVNVKFHKQDDERNFEAKKNIVR